MFGVDLEEVIGDPDETAAIYTVLGKPQKKFFNGRAIQGLPPPPSSLMAAGTFFSKLKKVNSFLMASPLPPPPF